MYICWEIDNFVIKSTFLGDFSFVRIFLKNYRVTMTTTLDTLCSENTIVLSARPGFLLHLFNFFATSLGIGAKRNY
jgi:hypothetical protein